MLVWIIIAFVAIIVPSLAVLGYKRIQAQKAAECLRKDMERIRSQQPTAIGQKISSQLNAALKGIVNPTWPGPGYSVNPSDSLDEDFTLPKDVDDIICDFPTLYMQIRAALEMSYQVDVAKSRVLYAKWIKSGESAEIYFSTCDGLEPAIRVAVNYLGSGHILSHREATADEIDEYKYL